MNFFQRINWRFFIPFIIFGFLFFITPTRDGVGKGVFFILRPILLFGAEGGSHLNSFGKYFQALRSLEVDNAELILENIRLKERVIDNDALHEENVSMKKIVPFIEQKKRSRISTRVLGRFFDPAGSTILIDGGSDQGMTKGALVIANERLLIGRISKIFGTASSVFSIRNVGTTLGVVIIPLDDGVPATTTVRERVEGLFIGRGDSMAIDLVPNTVPVQIGDLVVTNDFIELGVSDLIVGEVVFAKKNETRQFQDIFIRDIIPPSFLRSVFVIGGAL